MNFFNCLCPFLVQVPSTELLDQWSPGIEICQNMNVIVIATQSQYMGYMLHIYCQELNQKIATNDFHYSLTVKQGANHTASQATLSNIEKMAGPLLC